MKQLQIICQRPGCRKVELRELKDMLSAHDQKSPDLVPWLDEAPRSLPSSIQAILRTTAFPSTPSSSQSHQNNKLSKKKSEEDVPEQSSATGPLDLAANTSVDYSNDEWSTTLRPKKKQSRTQVLSSATIKPNEIDKLNAWWMINHQNKKHEQRLQQKRWGERFIECFKKALSTLGMSNRMIQELNLHFQHEWQGFPGITKLKPWLGHKDSKPALIIAFDQKAIGISGNSIGPDGFGAHITLFGKAGHSMRDTGGSHIRLYLDRYNQSLGYGIYRDSSTAGPALTKGNVTLDGTENKVDGHLPSYWADLMMTALEHCLTHPSELIKHPDANPPPWGGKKTKKQRKQRKTKSKKSKAHKSKRVKRKIRKHQ